MGRDPRWSHNSHGRRLQLPAHRGPGLKAMRLKGVRCVLPGRQRLGNRVFCLASPRFWAKNTSHSAFDKAGPEGSYERRRVGETPIASDSS